MTPDALEIEPAIDTMDMYEKNASKVQHGVDVLRTSLDRILLIASGMLAGMATMQVIIVQSKENDQNFLAFYSRPAGFIRFWLFLFNVLCAVLSLSNLSTQILREKQQEANSLPSTGSKSRMYLLCGVYALAFLCTVVIADVDDAIYWTNKQVGLYLHFSFFLLSRLSFRLAFSLEGCFFFSLCVCLLLCAQSIQCVTHIHSFPSLPSPLPSLFHLCSNPSTTSIQPCIPPPTRNPA